MFRIFLLASVAWVLCIGAQAATYDCRVERKFDSERVYPKENLDRYKPRVVVHVTEDGAQLLRCSIFPSAGGAETCDTYEVDHIVSDGRVGVSKYYYFEGQFDMQIFPDGYFVENNGRGTVSFGRCSYSP
jgi:hypothetical protein